jgi:hypothetical protein
LMADSSASSLPGHFPVSTEAHDHDGDQWAGGMGRPCRPDPRGYPDAFWRHSTEQR